MNTRSIEANSLATLISSVSSRVGFDWFDGASEEIKFAIERQWRTACDATRGKALLPPARPSRRNSAVLACVLGANFVAARKLDRSP